MMATIDAAVFTLQDFLALPERDDDGNHYELSEGKLVTLSPAGYLHGIIVGNIARLLGTALRRSQFLVPTGETGFVLDRAERRATVRGADVAVTRRSDHVCTGMYTGAPVIAVEVVSPSNTAQDLDKKTQQYLATGTEEVWIVYPETRRVFVHSRAMSHPTIYTEEQVLRIGPLDVEFAVSEFFEM